MKNTILCVSVLCVFLGLLSCKNEDERIRKEIIGSFHYAIGREGNMGFSSVVEGIETFHEDGTVSDNSILTLKVLNERVGELLIRFEVELKGKYEINNSYIIYDYSDDDAIINIEMLPVENAGDNEVFIEELQAQITNNFVSSYKERMADANAANIYELNEENLVILNPEGEKIIKERVTDDD